MKNITKVLCLPLAISMLSACELEQDSEYAYEIENRTPHPVTLFYSLKVSDELKRLEVPGGYPATIHRYASTGKPNDLGDSFLHPFDTLYIQMKAPYEFKKDPHQRTNWEYLYMDSDKSFHIGIGIFNLIINNEDLESE